MSKLEIDTARDPLVWVKFTGKVRMNDFEKQAEFFESRLDNAQPYCVLIDYRKASGFTSPGIGKFWNTWTERHFDRLRENVWGSATVFQGRVITSIANVVIKTSRIPHPQKSFRDVGEAVGYLEGIMGKRGAVL